MKQSGKSRFSFYHYDVLLSQDVKLKWQSKSRCRESNEESNWLNGHKHTRFLCFIPLRKRAQASFPTAHRWFELAPAFPRRMSCNDANLEPFWQELDTWYVGQLPHSMLVLPIHKYWAQRDWKAKNNEWLPKKKTWTIEQSLNGICCSVADLQPHLLLH